MKKILLFLTFICFFFNSFAQGGIEFNLTSTWTELLKLSSSTDRLIFLDCYTTWCGPCKGMAKDVFPDKTVGDFMNKTFICTSRDMEKGEGIELNKTYKKFIPGYPTYLLINSTGEVVFQVSGYLAPEKFIESMKSGLEQKSWIALSKKYESNKRNWSISNEYLARLEAAFQSKILDSVKNELLPMLTFEDISTDKNAYNIFRKYFKNVEDSLFIKFMGSTVYRKYKDPESEIGVWSGRLYGSKVREYSTLLLKDKSVYNLNNSEKLLSQMRRFSFNGREELIACMLLYNAAFNNETDKFFNLLEYAKNFGLLRYKNSEISSIIRKFYSNPANKKVLEKCLQYTKVEPNQKFLLSTELRNYAYFLEKSGDKTQSVSLIQKADSIDKDLKEKFGSMLK